MRDQYGQQSFTTFHSECRSLLSQFGSDTAHPALICSKLDAQLNKMAAEDRRAYQQVITDAFLADLETMHQTTNHPIVMFLDVYENANDPTKTWIAEQLIMGIRAYPWLVCVIAGQQTPRIAAEGRVGVCSTAAAPLRRTFKGIYSKSKVHAERRTGDLHNKACQRPPF